MEACVLAWPPPSSTHPTLTVALGDIAVCIEMRTVVSLTGSAPGDWAREEAVDLSPRVLVISLSLFCCAWL